MESGVSVITVVYNSVFCIEKTIESIISQSYKNIEYIIIDGGSTDGTLEIVEKYKDKIACIVSEPDQGIYDAMNKGIKYATHDWINFMNAGDVFCSKDTIYMLSKYFRSNYDLIYGKTCMIVESMEYIKKCPLRKKNNPMPFVHQSSFCRRNLLSQYPFSLKFKYAADYNFFYETYEIVRALYVDIVVSSYSLGGVSSQNTVATNREKRLSNPCMKNYIECFLGYRNYLVKMIFNILHIDMHKLKYQYYLWNNN